MNHRMVSALAEYLDAIGAEGEQMASIYLDIRDNPNPKDLFQMCWAALDQLRTVIDADPLDHGVPNELPAAIAHLMSLAYVFGLEVRDETDE